MLIQFFADYVKHRLTSKSRHGTHSPFVYKLVDEVIYDFSAKKVYEEIEKQRKKLLNDDTILTISNLEAGSHLNRRREKKVSEVAKNALKNPRLTQLVYRLAHHHPLQNIIELGTCLGITTVYLAKANPTATVVTMEGCPDTANVAYQNFVSLGLTNVELQVGNFNDLFPKEVENTAKLDLVYINGNRTKEATLNYFNTCLPNIHEGTLLIFNDIYWGKGMKDAWETIKAHPQVTVTIDLFAIGLVYFKKDQVKEHFKIKF
ncbi:class I SAM-dependent methyltransferase [Pedobacter sp. Du54]|uniref:O-methyltransferase n=1 Tax=Pedobacter anseongensis TaxID=3133439 RepID=UPI0030A0BD62